MLLLLVFGPEEVHDVIHDSALLTPIIQDIANLAISVLIIHFVEEAILEGEVSHSGSLTVMRLNGDAMELASIIVVDIVGLQRKLKLLVVHHFFRTSVS